MQSNSGAGALDVGSLAAGHDQERAGDRVLRGAADRGVDHAAAGVSQPRRDLIGHGRQDGAHVDEQGVLGEAVQYAVGAECRREDVIAIGQHGDHEVGAGGGLPGRGSDGAAILADRDQSIGVEVVGGHGMAALDQIAGHGEPHDAGADETDLAHVIAPLMTPVPGHSLSQPPEGTMCRWLGGRAGTRGKPTQVGTS